MSLVTLKTIEHQVADIAGRESYDDEVLFELLLAYGRSPSNTKRLRSGAINVAADKGCEFAQRNVVYYRRVEGLAGRTEAERENTLLRVANDLAASEITERNKIRFTIATDHERVAAVDTKTGDTRVFPLRLINRHVAFFLPWAGMEKAQYTGDRPADTTAAAKMGDLFDALVARNKDALTTPEQRHGLNIFFTRLLFCYFAEDTGLMPEGAFTTAIASQTTVDGHDVAEVMTAVFDAMDTKDKSHLPEHLKTFPYVNGALFSADADYVVPQFDKKSRLLLLDLGRLTWQDINPDIFGTMFQAVVHTGERAELGQHYTSVPNILKTIEPLFLDDLREEYESSANSRKKLEKLLARIGTIKVFDPACGSGNFLVIAYKELRRLEHAILERLTELGAPLTLFDESVVKIEHFFGIEIDDFATEVAVLALWIAKHQMNREFAERFGFELPLLPLKSMGQIHCANACRIDWEEVCPHGPEDEVYLIGNPPYVGSSMQSKEQKDDLAAAYANRKYSKSQDYISCWFIKGADYISQSASQLAFISTNSIAQGDHVAQLFPTIIDMGLEIGYCVPSFKWRNNAKGGAGVSVCVVSLRVISPDPKCIYDGFAKREVKAINCYLTDGPQIIVSKRSKGALSGQFPKMDYGSKPTDGGGLILDTYARDSLLAESPEASRYIFKFMGAAELIKSDDRFCLWISDDDLYDAQQIRPIGDRLMAVRQFRLSSRAPSTRDYAMYPHRFRQRAYKPTNSIIVPGVSSELRTYVPIGFLGPDVVVSNKGFVIYDAESWLFSILTSKMHMAWLGAVGGRMRTDYSYSSTLVYNTFPLRPLTDEEKDALTQSALRILDVREYYCEKTLGELYDPDKMPELLQQAHAENDLLVDRLYRSQGFITDEERLSHLFDLYQRMIDDEAKESATASTSKHTRSPRRTKES